MTGVEGLEVAFRMRTTGGAGSTTSGRPTVACIGTSAPAEVIRAMGFSVRWVVARPGSATPNADAFLESGYGPEMRSILEQILTGEVDGAALLVLDRAFRDVFYYLKELVRLGLAPTLPPIHMLDLVLSHDLRIGEYNRDQVGRLIAALQRVGGAALTDDRLHEQIAVTNARTRELHLLQQHRLRGAFTGTSAFRVMAAGSSLEPERHTELLGELNRSLAETPDKPALRVLLWTGEALFHDELHKAVESPAIQVVDESDAWSASAQWLIDEGGAPLEAIVAHAGQTSIGPELRPFAARAARFDAALAATAPDVVLFYVPPNDSLFGWDYPALRESALASGARPVLVRSDVLATGGPETVRAGLRTALRGIDPSSVDLEAGGVA